MPNVSLDAFRGIATQQNESAQITLKGDTGELKTRGLWGQFKNFFNIGGKAAKNQATVQAFCNTITQEMGRDLGGAAKAFLGGALAEKKPLTGNMIQTTLHLLEHEQGRIAQHNQDMLARYLTEQPGQERSPFEAEIAKYLPPGVELQQGDADEILGRLRQTVDRCTAEHEPVILETLNAYIHRYCDVLESADGTFMERLNQFCREGIPPLTGPQIKELRPLIIAANVRDEGDLRAAMDFMRDFQGKIPELRGLDASGGSVDLVALLGDLNASKERAFTANGVGGEGRRSDVFEIINLAVQSAFKLDGTQTDAMGEIGAKLSGFAAKNVLKALNTAIDLLGTPPTVAPGEAPPPPTVAHLPAMALKGMFSGLLTPLNLMGAITDAQVDKLPMLSGISSFTDQQLQIYFHLSGLLPDNAVGVKLGVELDSFQAISQVHIPLKDLVAALGGLKVVRDQAPIPLDDLALLATTLGISAPGEKAYTLHGAACILFSALTEMKLAQHDGLPFTPQTVWHAVFQQEPDASVTSANLASKLTEAVEKILNERIDRQGISDMKITEMAWPNAMNAASYGISPFRAFDLLLAENKAGASVEFRDISPLSGSAHEPLDTAEEFGLAQMTLDFPRVGYGVTPAPVLASLTVNDGEAIQFNDDLIADGQQRANYRAGGRDNPIIQGVMDQVRTLCGEGDGAIPQRASVYLLLSQFALGQLRFMSSLVGAVLDEHSACEMKLDRLDNGEVRLRLETVEGSHGYAKLEFMIAPNGNYRQTDFLLAHERPNPA
ncbi:hypothetical protein AGMMS50256_23510 [Betaproteobacteria bacterium]|nr:hypothetical protein AGMMS50256_23510 [Betaproteobacteria bacterium]